MTRPGPQHIGTAAASDGDVMVYNAATDEWEPQPAPSSGMTDPTTTKGDLIVRGEDPPATRFGVGPDGWVLTGDASQTLGMKWAAPGSSGGPGWAVESYDDAVAALTGLVHRWKFDETSGTTVADAVGSLPLTMSGTYTRHVTSPTGFGTAMTAGKAESTGLGSIPVGDTARCFVTLYRTNNDGALQSLNSYGSQATRQWWDVNHRAANCPALVVWGDDLVPTYWVPSMTEIRASGTRDWHLTAAGYDPTTAEIYAYRDGLLFTRLLGGVMATPTTGNFRVGTDTANGDQLSGAVDDVLVMNNWPGKAALDRLLCAAAGIPNLH